MIAVFSNHSVKKGLREKVGTLSENEGTEMLTIIDQELERLKGDFPGC